MKESYREDLANHFGLELYANGGNVMGIEDPMGPGAVGLSVLFLSYGATRHREIPMVPPTFCNREVEILAGGTVTGNYNFVRSAKFEAARTSSASAVGGGGISPQMGGDTGQTTASWSNGQTGDTQVAIVLTGNDAGISLTGGKTALEMYLEAMFGYGLGSSSGSESGGESGGSSSGGSSGGGSSGGDS